MKDIKLFTRGITNSDHIGGWACILAFQGLYKELSGFIPNSNENRMELLSIISGIGAIKEPCNIEVMLSSEYVFEAINSGKIKEWIDNNWKDSNQKKIENEDLWRMLIIQHRVKKHNVRYLREKSRTSDEYLRCNELANNAIQEFITINSPVNE